MSEVARFPFADAKPGPPGSSLMPLLPLLLSPGDRQREVVGLLDIGAVVNVLPCSALPGLAHITRRELGQGESRGRGSGSPA